MNEILIIFNENPRLLNDFQYNVALMVTLFKFKQVQLFKMLGVTSGSFSNYLKIGGKKRASMPKEDKLINFEQVFLIKAYRFRSERLTKEDFNPYIEANNLEGSTFDKLKEVTTTGTFGKANEILNTGTFGKAYQIHKRFKGENLVNEPKVETIQYKNGIPFFNINTSSGYFSDWIKKSSIEKYLPNDFFNASVDFAVKILDSSMELEGHPYNIPVGSTLGLREATNLKQPMHDKVYLISTRKEKPIIKILKLIDQENEVVELESLNKTDYPQKISYNFKDAPVFYDVAAVIFPSVVFN